MNSMDSPGRPEPAEPPMATITGGFEVRRGSRGKRVLELQVNIAGRDRAIWLTDDELASYGLSGPAAVDELRGIRAALERIANALERSPETE